MDALDEIRFLLQVHGDSQRTLICEPDRVPAVQAAVDQLDTFGVFTVRESLACPAGKILVLDEQALEASWRQTIQRIRKGGIRLHGESHYET